eukprot:5948395-Amphidinium_carterae.1
MVECTRKETQRTNPKHPLRTTSMMEAACVGLKFNPHIACVGADAARTQRELVEVGVAERKARRKVRQDGPNAQKGAAH